MQKLHRTGCVVLSKTSHHNDHNDLNIFCLSTLLVTEASPTVTHHWWPRAVWGTLAVCWRFSPDTGERELSALSPDPWHTERTLPCIPKEDGGGTGRGEASEQNTVAPGSTHPTEPRERRRGEKRQWMGGGVVMKMVNKSGIEFNGDSLTPPDW